jgi:RimJ/RimL family protein N-acetyltransferase
MKRYLCMSHPRLDRSAYSFTAVQPEDIESIRQWRNSQIDVLRQPAPITCEQQQQYYATHIWPDTERPHPANLLLSYCSEGRLIGYGGLVHIAWDHMRAEVSFLLDPERAADPGQYGEDFTNFLALMKELAFEELGLRRLFTETYAHRHLHISLLQKSGFCREGVLRQHVLIDGNPVDSLIHGCLETDAR